MSNGYRDNNNSILAFAVIVLLGIFSLIGYTLGKDKGQSQATEIYADSHKQYAADKIQSDCIGINASVVPKCVKEAIEASIEQQRAEHNLQAQQNMSDWAWWLLILTFFTTAFTGFGVWYVRDTLIATQSMARDTREIGQQQTRAYLDAVKFEILPVKLGDELIFHGMVHLKNSGQSPATDVLVRISTNNAPHDQFKKLGRIGAGVTEVAQMQLPYIRHEEGRELFVGADVTLSYDTVFSDIGRIEDAHSAPFSARFYPEDRVPQKMIALGSRVIVVG